MFSFPSHGRYNSTLLVVRVRYRLEEGWTAEFKNIRRSVVQRGRYDAIREGS